jgi:hypothetical protein
VLQHLAKQFYHREDKPRKPLLDPLGIGIDPIRQRIGERRQLRDGRVD